MSIRIEKYNALRLEEFIESPEYQNMPVIPVSYHRALSWLNNPRLDPKDTLMYTAHEGEDMVAYRCIYPDWQGDQRFGWLSGNWVAPAKRRQGIASLLFDEAFRDWNGSLMYTEYAPESKAVYDKTGRFELYAERQGLRYYLRSSAAALLGSRNRLFRIMRPAMSLFDSLINTWQDARLNTAHKKNNPELLLAEPLEGMDKEVLGFLSTHKRLGFSLRDHETFTWIQAYPWIREDIIPDKRYYFSSTAIRFENTYLKLIDDKGKLESFLMLTSIDDKMTIPYACFTEEEPTSAMKTLDHYLAVRGISYLTIYNPEIIRLMKNSCMPLLGKRKMIRKYFVTRELKKKLPESSKLFFQDGDGDVVFT